MPNKQQGLLAFFILQETASILRMNIIVSRFVYSVTQVKEDYGKK